MEDLEIRQNILQKFYELFRKKGFGAAISAMELSSEMGVDIEAVEKEMRTLKALGLTKSVTRFNDRITEQGIMAFESQPEPSETHIHNRIEISGGSVGSIVQGHTINSSIQFFERLVKEIDQLPDVGPEKKKQWKETLWEMSKHPNLPSIIEKLLSLIGLCPG